MIMSILTHTLDHPRRLNGTQFDRGAVTAWPVPRYLLQEDPGRRVLLLYQSGWNHRPDGLSIPLRSDWVQLSEGCQGGGST